MAVDLNSYFNEKFDIEPQDIRTYSPLTLAYIGDAIFDVIVRSILVNKGNTAVNNLHKRASGVVKAQSQAAIVKALMDDFFTQEEIDIFKRGRNSKPHTKAKNASTGEYLIATGFEAVMGYLYLQGNTDRAMELLEAFRSGKSVDRLFVLDGCKDGPVQSILREAKKHKDTVISFVKKERLDQLSETGKHQGVLAYAASYEYAEVEDILAKAKEKGEDPFVIVLDNIEDPHNLGAIIRTANLAGAHGVIIPKHRAVGLTATVAKASAGASNYTPVAKVTNIAQTIEELKDQGLWFVCADMGGTKMYDLNLKGPIGLVIGNEGSGVGRLVKEKCDMIASIPMKGDIDSLNASVAAGVLAFEIVRQRMN